MLRLVLLMLLFLSAPVPALAERALVAVATNFAGPIVALQSEFEKQTGHQIDLVMGSTGKLYAQVASGAPFDVFLAADEERPRRLLEEGMAVEGSGFTFAEGRLALWSGRGQVSGFDSLEAMTVRHIAIANPKLAPYGVAAVEAMQSQRVWNGLSGKIVMGENVGQAFALTESGNADIGFVALSGLVNRVENQDYWVVPADYHTPIRQDAVLLRNGIDNTAAIAFLAYLQSREAQALIVSLGYGARLP